MTSDTHAAAPVDQGEWPQTRSGERCLIRVAAAETNGVYSFAEIVSDPGDGTPLHVHQNEDEHLFVLEGTVRFALGDKVFDAEAGTMFTPPKNIPHAWANRSTSKLRAAGICYPHAVLKWRRRCHAFTHNISIFQETRHDCNQDQPNSCELDQIHHRAIDYRQRNWKRRDLQQFYR